MIDEYKKGRTPNPDVMCNREVKFGVFWDFAKKHGADFIATGHYAQNNYDLRISNYELKKGKDHSKDQSYFLWTLKQEDLEHILFPVGHLNKTDVRKLAKKYKIPVAEKKDSQGVCFLGPLDMKDFLRHYIKSEKGDVLLMNQDNDLGNESEIIGSHDGAVFFTIGERHGFNITKNTAQDKPYYIVAKDIDKNTITVSHKSDLWQPTSRSSGNNGGSIINLTNTNWITNPQKNKNYTCQIRYHGELLNCNVNYIQGISAEIIFEKNILVDKGQSVVIYEGDICIGGGIVR
jgi:tRNA-specific 2-thiouridylase